MHRITLLHTLKLYNYCYIGYCYNNNIVYCQIFLARQREIRTFIYHLNLLQASFTKKKLRKMRKITWNLLCTPFTPLPAKSINTGVLQKRAQFYSSKCSENSAVWKVYSEITQVLINISFAYKMKTTAGPI